MLQVNWPDLEREMLSGQTLEGLDTCRQLYISLGHLNCRNKFPLFCHIYLIAEKKCSPNALFCWKN